MLEFNKEQFEKDWMDFETNMSNCELTKNFDMESLKEKLKYAPCGMNEDSGNSYPGALIRHIVLFTAIAKRLLKMSGDIFKIEEKSLVKVCLLMHLSKIEMYIQNTNDWEINNRGLNYKFREMSGCLKFGQRSIIYAVDNGVKFTPEEFEAMTCLEKNTDTNYFESPIAMIIRQANEFAYAIEKEKHKNLTK